MYFLLASVISVSLLLFELFPPCNGKVLFLASFKILTAFSFLMFDCVLAWIPLDLSFLELIMLFESVGLYLLPRLGGFQTLFLWTLLQSYHSLSNFPPASRLEYMSQKENGVNSQLCHSSGPKVPCQSAFFSLPLRILCLFYI